VLAKYERIVPKLKNKYPLHFTIIGRHDAQDAADLFDEVKKRISSSSYAIFDATGANANVSLEFGYAEGLDVPRSIFLSQHKAASRNVGSALILSDLNGVRRVQYKMEKALAAKLHRFCEGHPFTARFESALSEILRGKTSGQKKTARALALKLIHALDGLERVQRRRLVEYAEASKYAKQSIEIMIADLCSAGILRCRLSPKSFATIV
jgi:hypothetical protein